MMQKSVSFSKFPFEVQKLIEQITDTEKDYSLQSRI